MPAYTSKTLIQGSFWLAAIAVGLAGILFEKLVELAQHLFFEISEYNIYVAVAATPLLFLLSAALVVKLAPHASGSGIPQASRALLLSLGSHHSALASGLISLKTAS